MSKPFSILAILLLVVLSGLQAFQLATGAQVNFNALPIAFGIVAILLLLGLAIGLWYEVFGRREEPAAAGSREMRGGTRSITRGKAAPVWVVNGQRQPADYFMFASRGVSVKSIKGAADKYDRIMVGFDAGNIPEAALKAAHDVGAELEIYIEGPGGPTGNSWSPDERARVRRASAKVGIDTSKNSWMKEWDDWGWKAYSFLQLEEFMGEGYSAGEIDNLSRVLGEGTEKLIEFYQEYGERCLAGHLPRLIMKNNSPEQLQAVVAAVKSGDLPREMFAEFHICEKGTGFNRKKLDEISQLIAIRTVPSNDTFNYDAYGEFGLAAQFARLLPAPAPPAPVPSNDTGPAAGTAVASGSPVAANDTNGAPG